MEGRGHEMGKERFEGVKDIHWWKEGNKTRKEARKCM